MVRAIKNKSNKKQQIISFKFYGTRQELESLLNYIIKNYKCKLICIYIDQSILKNLVKAIPLVKYIFDDGVIIILNCPIKIRNRCKNCGFPDNKKDLIDKHEHRFKIDCRCCFEHDERIEKSHEYDKQYKNYKKP